MSRRKKHFDVLVVGGGMTGLSTVHHLQAMGVDSVVLADEGIPSVSSESAGWLLGSPVDHYTRVSHAHGLAFTHELVDYYLRSFSDLVNFASQNSLPVQLGDRFRILQTKAEIAEGAIAVQQWSHKEHSARLSAFGASKGKVIIERGTAAAVEVKNLLRKLESTVGQRFKSKVFAIHTHGNRVETQLTNGALVTSEIVVLSAHLGNRHLLPFMADIMVPVVEQVMVFGCRSDTVFRPKRVVSSHNGHMVGFRRDRDSIVVKGLPYARKFAGIGSVDVSYSLPVEQLTRAELVKLDPSLSDLSLLGSKVGLDIRPCDELPVVGPVFGEDRLLIGAGYMGMGLTVGFEAGKSIANLIVHGRCDQLPRRLWPERLRSLEVGD